MMLDIFIVVVANFEANNTQPLSIMAKNFSIIISHKNHHPITLFPWFYLGMRGWFGAAFRDISKSCGFTQVCGDGSNHKHFH